MDFNKIISTISEYISTISAAVARIFSPFDDRYPEIGVQPFEGEPYNE